MSRYSPFDVIADHPHWTLGFIRLPDGESGRWYDHLKVMLIDNRLGRIARRVTAAHEVEHALAGDAACRGTASDSWYETRLEQAVDRAAARKLIALDALADVLQWALGPDEVAEELDVEPAVVRNRIRHLTDAEKAYIEQRIEARWIA